MHADVRWVLDVSLSEQEICAMLIIFMDDVVGRVLDISLSEQEMRSIYVDNDHGHCCWVGP
jgi:hypothetical protein